VAYTPPWGVDILKAKLANLLDFLNDARYSLNPVPKIAIGHFQFDAIHSLRDGNRHTGRMFNINYFTHKGLLDYPILFLSKYIVAHQADYYAYLGGMYQRGDWAN
jgi:Fic family protein